MEFRILGPVEAGAGGFRLNLGGEKPRTVTAALLLARGRVVPDSQLSDMLWGTNPPATARSQLHTYMSRLRTLFGPGVRIAREACGYALDIGPAGYDHAEFERLSELGQSRLAAGRPEEAAQRLSAALELWRGPALGNVTEFLADAHRPRLEEARMSALEGRIEAELALGRHASLVTELLRLVAEHPLRERLRAQLMIALYRCGRKAEALSVYDNARRLLADELGIAPGAALDQVFRAVLRDALPAPAARGAAVVTHRIVRPAMLPADTYDFTGRRAAMRILAEENRVVVTGMAGVGKTALAVHSAHACRAEFPDGQLYVDLGGAEHRPRDPADVLAWFLRALGVADRSIPATRDERGQLYRSLLASRKLLVLLDNAHGDAQVAPLLPGGPTCRAIVTGRRCAALTAGARFVDLDMLDAAETRTLLGRIIGPDRVTAEPQAAAHLGELCGHLPLAVRIAAGRLAARPDWPIAHLVHRLESSPSTLDELVHGELTVRGRLETSWADLTPPQRAALHRLATLTTPELSTWAAARALATTPQLAERVLDGLIDARLVRPTAPDNDGQPRYRIHPLVRQLVLDLTPARELALAS